MMFLRVFGFALLFSVSVQEKFPPSSENSDDLFEGDIMLTPQQRNAVEKAIKNHGNLFYSSYQSKAVRAGDLRRSCGNGNFVPRSTTYLAYRV